MAILRPPDQRESQAEFEQLSLTERAVQWARYAADTIHLHESHSNQGQMLEDFMGVLAAGHMDFAPWCAEGVVSCAVRAGLKESYFPSGYRRVKVLRDWARRENRIVPSSRLRRGDWYGYVNPVTGNGHIGIVVRVEGNKIYTIEFNTNKEGSREGTAVLRKVRPVKSSWFGIRWA